MTTWQCTFCSGIQCLLASNNPDGEIPEGCPFGIRAEWVKRKDVNK